MENIIKKAIEGGYNGVSHQNQKGRWTGARVLSLDDMAWVVLDPLFWQALAQTQFKGWGDVPSENFCGWLYNAQEFYRINLTQGFDKAVEYLEEIIK